MAQIEIYHNVARNGDGFFGLNTVLAPIKFVAFGVIIDSYAKYEIPRSHPLVKVYAYDSDVQFIFPMEEPDDLALCEVAFHMFNGGSGRENRAYFDRKLRSLSVGDVVVIDGRPYSCESAGFKPRKVAELRIVEDFSPDPSDRDWGAHFWHDRQLVITVPWQEIGPERRPAPELAEHWKRRAAE